MFFVQMEPVKGPRAYGPGRGKCLGEIPGVAQKKFGFLTDFSKKQAYVYLFGDLPNFEKP